MRKLSVSKMIFQTSTIATVCSALIISGCATTKNANGVLEYTGGCDPVAMAFVGALIGAAIGGKNNRAEGAALGAAVGGLGCLAWNYKTKQTKTAAQVNEEYKVANSGNLPSIPTLVDYSVAPDPSNTLSAGSPMVIRSQIKVVDGKPTNSQVVIEEQMIISHNGKEITNARKRANDGSGAGEYETRFQLNLPSGVPQGYYPVRTALYVNGTVVATRNLDVQVVMLNSGEKVAYLDGKRIEAGF